jgi:two-component system alkaline phosphatase synthesis response regulator PhoP
MILPDKGQSVKKGKIAKVKILLLEDYPDLISFYVGRLQDAGFEVLTENDEDQGLELALKFKPDLIILDISLPKADDFGFIQEMKKHPEIAATPVVILTDLFSEEDVKRGLASGASLYLIREKFTFIEIIDKLKEILKKGN